MVLTLSLGAPRRFRRSRDEIGEAADAIISEAAVETPAGV